MTSYINKNVYFSICNSVSNLNQKNLESMGFLGELENIICNRASIKGKNSKYKCTPEFHSFVPAAENYMIKGLNLKDIFIVTLDYVTPLPLP